MTSYSTFIIIKLMTIWNYLVELYSNTKEKSHNFYYYIKDYCYGYNDTWLFVPGHTLPLSLNNLNNTVYSTWLYDNYDTSLTINTNNIKLNKYKFSWLSAKIVIYKEESDKSGIEYEIDNFIDKFSLNTIDDIVPSLYMFFMCWCAYTKHWFSPDDIVEFHIIDNMGEDIILNLNNHNDSLCIKRNKICIVVHSNDENIKTNEIIDKSEIKMSDNILLDEENKNKDE